MTNKRKHQTIRQILKDSHDIKLTKHAFFGCHNQQKTTLGENAQGLGLKEVVLNSKLLENCLEDFF